MQLIIYLLLVNRGAAFSVRFIVDFFSNFFADGAQFTSDWHTQWFSGTSSALQDF